MATKLNKQIVPEVEVPREGLQASLDIFHSVIIATVYKGSDIKKRAIVEAEQVADIIGKSTAVKSQWIQVDKNVTAVCFSNSDVKRCLVVRPAARAIIECKVGRKVKRLKVNVPNLLADITSNKKGWKSIVHVYAFAGRASRLNDRTVLYVPPLPNIQANGRVCMGSVKLSDWGRLPISKAFEEAFFGTYFTDHYITEPLRSTGKYRNILHALKKTRGNVPFSLLEKVGTYGKIFKRL